MNGRFGPPKQTLRLRAGSAAAGPKTDTRMKTRRAFPPASRPLIHGARAGPICGARTGLHAVEDHDALAAAAGRKRFARRADAAVDILPVVHHPDIASRIDIQVGLHLQASSDIAARRRNLVARMHPGRTMLGANAAQLDDGAAWRREIGDPDVIVAVHCHGPRAGETAASERRAGIGRAVRPQQRDAATVACRPAARTSSSSGSRRPPRHPRALAVLPCRPDGPCPASRCRTGW